MSKKKRPAIWLKNTRGAWCVGLPPRAKATSLVEVTRRDGSTKVVQIESEVCEKREFEGVEYSLHLQKYEPRRYGLLNVFGAIDALSVHGYDF